MSLDISVSVEMPIEVFETNITNNLVEMAHEAGLYNPMWCPESIIGMSGRAEHLIPFLEQGIDKMKRNPLYFKKFNPKNGWGDYELLLREAGLLLETCKTYPQGKIKSQS